MVLISDNPVPDRIGLCVRSLWNIRRKADSVQTVFQCSVSSCSCINQLLLLSAVDQICFSSRRCFDAWCCRTDCKRNFNCLRKRAVSGIDIRDNCIGCSCIPVIAIGHLIVSVRQKGVASIICCADLRSFFVPVISKLCLTEREIKRSVVGSDCIRMRHSSCKMPHTLNGNRFFSNTSLILGIIYGIICVLVQDCFTEHHLHARHICLSAIQQILRSNRNPDIGIIFYVDRHNRNRDSCFHSLIILRIFRGEYECVILRVGNFFRCIPLPAPAAGNRLSVAGCRNVQGTWQNILSGVHKVIGRLIRNNRGIPLHKPNCKAHTVFIIPASFPRPGNIILIR